MHPVQITTKWPLSFLNESIKKLRKPNVGIFRFKPWVDAVVAAVTDFLSPNAGEQTLAAKPTGSLAVLTKRAFDSKALPWLNRIL